MSEHLGQTAQDLEREHSNRGDLNEERPEHAPGTWVSL